MLVIPDFLSKLLLYINYNKILGYKKIDIKVLFYLMMIGILKE